MQLFTNVPAAQAYGPQSLLASAVRTFVSLDAVRANYAAIALAAGQIRPLLVHVHVPKCAGSSVNDLLRRAARGAHLDLYSPVPRSVIPVDELADAIRARPDVRSVASHSIRLFPNILAGRAPLYVTFLRDPREWYVSNMTYLIKNYARLSDDHRAMLPPGCPRMSVRDLSDWLLDRDERDGRPPSDVTEFLAGPTYARHVAPALPAAPSREAADAAAVDLAKHLLGRFFFVGTVDRLAHDLRLLREKLAALDVQLPRDAGIPWVNTSHEIRGDLSWLHDPSDPAAVRVMRFLRRDRAVDAYARNLPGETDESDGPPISVGSPSLASV